MYSFDNPHKYSLVNLIKELKEFRLDVKVPRIAIATAAEIELYGEPEDYVFNKDRPLHGSRYNLITANLPIITILDVFNKNYKIFIVNKEDIKKIVEKLEDIHRRFSATLIELGGEDNEFIKLLEEFLTNIGELHGSGILKPTLEVKGVIGLDDSSGKMLSDFNKISNKVGVIDLDDIVIDVKHKGKK